MVIARFRFFITAIPTFIFLAICCAGYWIPLSYPGGPISYLHAKPNLLGYAIIAWLAAPFLMAPCIAVLYQLLIKGGVAVWEDNGSIIFVHRLFRNISIREIQSVGLMRAKTLGSPLLMGFHMRDGTTKRIGTVMLRESVGDIFALLEQMGIAVRTGTPELRVEQNPG